MEDLFFFFFFFFVISKHLINNTINNFVEDFFLTMGIKSLKVLEIDVLENLTLDKKITSVEFWGSTWSFEGLYKYIHIFHLLLLNL